MHRASLHCRRPAHDGDQRAWLCLDDPRDRINLFTCDRTVGKAGVGRLPQGHRPALAGQHNGAVQHANTGHDFAIRRQVDGRSALRFVAQENLAKSAIGKKCVTTAECNEAARQCRCAQAAKHRSAPLGERVCAPTELVLNANRFDETWHTHANKCAEIVLAIRAGDQLAVGQTWRLSGIFERLHDQRVEIRQLPAGHIETAKDLRNAQRQR